MGRYNQQWSYLDDYSEQLMKRLFTILLFVAAPAWAQQPQPPASPEVQALGNKLMEEIQSNIQLRTQLIHAQAQAKTQAEEIAKLKAATVANAKPPEPPKK